MSGPKIISGCPLIAFKSQRYFMNDSVRFDKYTIFIATVDISNMQISRQVQISTRTIIQKQFTRNCIVITLDDFRMSYQIVRHIRNDSRCRYIRHSWSRTEHLYSVSGAKLMINDIPIGNILFSLILKSITIYNERQRRIKHLFIYT